ncbi:MAG: SsrA-binding protein [Nitrospirae bacterium RIFCSPLOW2_12_42_9]|nr:MAG: SsrA-binding protein [Nitrospirae bacterium RIFCSPLOWO2_02_42_7]OGW59027.1 MAG: SsrA-binding protein [Nitrospirae bacterium RIFCSPHIGHO2_02_FULL_42_12]OGW62195.1 MAG: SsrA-binding protein [Nitrospirae bacterium RIFCSPLOW2_12_42_9]HAS17409.1 SsrA-binding protein [Nitrospiraceae bacterium]HBI23589.1 SsrA-binding protein [Nitrospiraceae bacterium]
MSEYVIATNKKAFYDYSVEETYEAGIQLLGTEIKSLRDGGASLKEGYARVERGEVFLYCSISPYKAGNINNHDPLRKRKLLLHREEINRILGRTIEKGYSLVPLKMYFKRGKAKIEIGVARGKKLHDRREDIKKKEAKREVAQAFKERQRQ